MRTFVAVEISKREILKKIQTFQEKIKIDAKATRVDQIHFTLQFLGEIDEEKCEQVKDVLNEIDFSGIEISKSSTRTCCLPAHPWNEMEDKLTRIKNNRFIN